MSTVKMNRSNSLRRGKMIFSPTDEQQSTGSLSEKVSNFFENLYWMYYIHLPYYLMTSFDAFCLHIFFLTIFTLSLFGIIKYIVFL
ncbi:LAFE_0E04544g1_1 [Lachancea fermentati]|uniref:LAFE_0E04544g1_1 n=1 Tax=Lachancea fermentati TaxID=4955 RepID=A0A1G4MCM8_LACFM|nr:LAFE_0E04544g1_1 [Lachancea fermentati]